MIIQQPQATTITDPHEERLRIQTERLIAYRDDGPLVTALKGLLGRGVSPVPPTLLAIAAIVAMAVGGVLTEGPILLAPVLVLVLLAAPTAPHHHLGRLDWLTPPLLRAAAAHPAVAVPIQATAYLSIAAPLATSTAAAPVASALALAVLVTLHGHATRHRRIADSALLPPSSARFSRRLV